MDKRKRKYSIEDIREAAILPICGLAILYYLIEPLLYEFRHIRIVVLIILAIIAWGVFFSSFIKSKNTDSKLYRENRTWTILKWTFIGYLCVYLILQFQLDTMSVYFNYLMVLIYGLVVGYRLRKS
jgi:predicted tellurium resistance membrane protein TerC